ncbi:GNAT family N-acetyltransferase, partial [Streptomyces sp. NPDC003470]
TGRLVLRAFTTADTDHLLALDRTVRAEHRTGPCPTRTRGDTALVRRGGACVSGRSAGSR